jgi:hypothetical protein
MLVAPDQDPSRLHRREISLRMLKIAKKNQMRPRIAFSAKKLFSRRHVHLDLASGQIECEQCGLVLSLANGVKCAA